MRRLSLRAPARRRARQGILQGACALHHRIHARRPRAAARIRETGVSRPPGAVALVNAGFRACALLHTVPRGANRILCCIAMKRQMGTVFKGLGLAAALLAGIAAAPLASAADEVVSTRLEARKVVTGPDGRERFAPAESAKPGDVIEYVATYR